jgi:hypothetical protein
LHCKIRVHRFVHIENPNQMKRNFLLLFCSISLLSIAQNITLNENLGNSSSYAISSVKKITFQSGDMVIETQSSSKNVALSDIKNLVFPQVITEVENLTQVLQALSVYPNPCEDVLNINQNSNDARYFIHDLNGSLVQSDKASSSINLSNLTTGVYFFTLVDKTNTQTLKIVKQ